MKMFYVDDNYDCKKEQNVRFKCFFFFFFLGDGEIREEGGGKRVRGTRGVEKL